MSLEEASAEHELQLQYLKVKQGFDPLRDDLQFQDVLRRVGLPQGEDEIKVSSPANMKISRYRILCKLGAGGMRVVMFCADEVSE
ncbi:MAG: hypothetical protein M3458_04945 [Acidobacteriota bacterium]|nr:hypothetical protein [Acidobacteriota bacterium]